MATPRQTVSAQVKIGPSQIRLSRRANSRIVPQRLMFVEIFLAGGQREDPLRQHLPLLVHHVDRIARIVQTPADRLDESQPPIDPPPQQQPGVRLQPPAVEIGHHLPPRYP